MHITEIVKTKQESDECISVTVRCCSNPLSDSTTTIYGVHAMSPEQLQAKVDAHRDKVVAKCHGMDAGKSLLASLNTQPKTHEVK